MVDTWNMNMEHQWNENEREKLKYWRKTCPRAVIPTTNPTWTDTRWSPDLWSDWIPTNHLSHGRAHTHYRQVTQTSGAYEHVCRKQTTGQLMLAFLWVTDYNYNINNRQSPSTASPYPSILQPLYWHISTHQVIQNQPFVSMLKHNGGMNKR